MPDTNWHNACSPPLVKNSTGKKNMNRKLLTLGVGLVAALSIQSEAATILIDSTNHDGITNLTNNGGALQLWAPQISGGQNAADLLDWLNEGSDFDPGQISQYNSLTTSTLAQAGGLVFEDGSIATSGLNGTYTFEIGTYYVAAHWGRFNTAHLLVVTDKNQTYGLVSDLNGTGQGNGGGGPSVIRVWNGGSGPQNGSVPDGGTTLVLLGGSLLGLGSVRRLMHKKA